MSRLKWEESKDLKKHSMCDVNDEDDKMVELVWEGSVKDRIFPKWTTMEMKSELEGRRCFADRGVEHYWDLATRI